LLTVVENENENEKKNWGAQKNGRTEEIRNGGRLAVGATKNKNEYSHWIYVENTKAVSNSHFSFSF